MFMYCTPFISYKTKVISFVIRIQPTNRSAKLEDLDNSEESSNQEMSVEFDSSDEHLIAEKEN